MAAANRGVMLSGASRPMKAEDLDKFDLIVGMVSKRPVPIAALMELATGDGEAPSVRVAGDYPRGERAGNRASAPSFCSARPAADDSFKPSDAIASRSIRERRIRT